MTKFEWERQLKKGISGLPKSEQRRVLEYYNELFSDKIDAGMREQEIIAEFGNPYDVANKLLVDYYKEERGNADADEYVYSDTDGIDDEFDDEPRRADDCDNCDGGAEQRRNRNVRHHIAAHKNVSSAGGLVSILCVLLFFVLGACFNMWHPAWMVFLAIPVVTSLVVAIEKRNFNIFCYPVFITLLYLVLGFYCNLWHPMWVLFITIPVYYTLGAYISKGMAAKKAEEFEQSERERKVPVPEREEKRKNKTRRIGVSRKIAGVLMTITLVILLIVVWATVLGLFVAGIGMIGGGILAFIWAFRTMSLAMTTAMIVLGGGLVAVGLGFVMTFGMAGVFKYCAKISNSFGKSISSCFGKE